MSLSDIVRVNIPSMSTGTGRWHEPNFSTYGTVAFDSSIMRKMIGFGTAYRCINTRIFVGYLPHPGHCDEPVGQVLPISALNLGIWLDMVPEAYREDIEEGIFESLWQEFGQRAVTPEVVPAIVEFLRRWIGQNVEPTTEHEARSVRFANIWFEIGVAAAYRQGRLTAIEAEEMLGHFIVRV